LIIKILLQDFGGVEVAKIYSDLILLLFPEFFLSCCI